jgi:hypothetical protein
MEVASQSDGFKNLTGIAKNGKSGNTLIPDITAREDSAVRSPRWRRRLSGENPNDGERDGCCPSNRKRKR